MIEDRRSPLQRYIDESLAAPSTPLTPLATLVVALAEWAAEEREKQTRPRQSIALLAAFDAYRSRP